MVRHRLGNETHIQKLTGIARYLVAAIDSIEIIGQAAIIHKRMPPDASQADAIRPHVEKANDWLGWLTFSQRLLRSDKPVVQMIDALQRALALNPNAVVVYERLSEALERSGDVAGAIRTLERAQSVAANQPSIVSGLQHQIDRLRRL